MTVTN